MAVKSETPTSQWGVGVLAGDPGRIRTGDLQIRSLSILIESEQRTRQEMAEYSRLKSYRIAIACLWMSCRMAHTWHTRTS